MCVYMDHLYIHAPPHTKKKKKIYLVGLPTVFYERPGQNERSVLNRVFLLFIRCFSVLFMYFSWKAPLFIQRVPPFMKKTEPDRYVCIHVPFTHTCTTKYHQNMIYLVGLPSVLYERPGQNERSVLNQLFLLFFMCFSVLFMKSTTFHTKSATFHEKKNRTRSICVYTCTIYTYMLHFHHQIPPKYKIYLVGLPSVLYERPGQNERSVFWISCFCCFSCAFHRKCWFSYKKYHISWKPTKPGQYVCIHVPFTHTYMHHQIPPKYDIPSWPSLGTLWKTRSKWERSVLNQLFLLLFMCFS